MSIDLSKSMKKWHSKAMKICCLTDRGANLFVNPTFRATQTILEAKGKIFLYSSEFDCLKTVFRFQLDLELNDYCSENNIAIVDESILLDFIKQSRYFAEEAIERFQKWQCQHQTVIEEKVALMLFLMIINC